MQKIKRTLFACAILLAAAIPAAQAQQPTTNAPVMPGGPVIATNADGTLSPSPDFIDQVESWFTTFDPGSTTFGSTTFAWIGADYVQGLNVAQAVGLEHAFWQSASLKASIAAATNLNGFSVNAETTERNAGVAGTLLTAGGGGGISFIKDDLRVTGFAEGEYNFALSKAGAELGLRAQKATGNHTYMGAGFSFETYRKTLPTLDVHIGAAL